MFPAPGLIKLIAAESRTLMDKCRSSRKQQSWLSRGNYLLTLLLITWTIALWPHISFAITLSHADVQRIGKKIWQNECNGTISGLTSWNQGEDFASLGIGHFIWYPKGRRGPFEESFPKVVNFISKRGAKLPTLLLRGSEQPCPWNSLAEFFCLRSTVNRLIPNHIKRRRHCDKMTVWNSALGQERIEKMQPCQFSVHFFAHFFENSWRQRMT